MPVADWNERSRINFQAIPPKINGITKLTRICSQPIASVLKGVTTGVPAGLVWVCDGEVVAVAVTGAAGAVTEVLLALVMVGPAVKVTITWASTPNSTS